MIHRNNYPRYVSNLKHHLTRVVIFFPGLQAREIFTFTTHAEFIHPLSTAQRYPEGDIHVVASTKNN